ncbi:thioesterase II family protein [Saccharopolyspora gregorii]|uniref:Alpha/beta fold hydrolase n=1 Tax=Saccharopolyspora gregorii TaxID=33914 RepID=A0ABP6RXQ9_9PSEU|nr:alpha/beta fold hydrolase [Saccharopolyspora gregorii]
MTGSTADTAKWIRRFQPAPEATARLVCFPHAGGAASYYFSVAKRLAPAIEVLAVQYPGRQDRRTEPCADSVQELAEQVLDQLRPWSDQPLALFGHSMGASVAFEVARRLEESGTPPRALFASGRTAPARTRNEGVHALPDDEFLDALRELDGTESAALESEELMKLALPALRADYRIAETYAYRPGPPLHCPLHVLLGVDDPKVSADEARDWAAHTTGAFRFHPFPGGHFYLNAESDGVLRLVREHLAR